MQGASTPNWTRSAKRPIIVVNAALSAHVQPRHPAADEKADRASWRWGEEAGGHCESAKSLALLISARVAPLGRPISSRVFEPLLAARRVLVALVRAGLPVESAKSLALLISARVSPLGKGNWPQKETSPAGKRPVRLRHPARSRVWPPHHALLRAPSGAECLRDGPGSAAKAWTCFSPLKSRKSLIL